MNLINLYSHHAIINFIIYVLNNGPNTKKTCPIYRKYISKNVFDKVEPTKILTIKYYHNTNDTNDKNIIRLILLYIASYCMMISDTVFSISGYVLYTMVIHYLYNISDSDLYIIILHTPLHISLRTLYERYL